MILFYSLSCQHCSILLETIKKHDTKKTIKLVCIDSKINILKNKITNVPALMFIPSKEIIYGKAVFDYLLLPNRGYLFTNNNTREKTNTTNSDNSSISSPIPLNKEIIPDEPSAFSLGSILTDNFSNIDDDNINSMNINNDKIYRWDLVDTNNNTNNLEDEYKAMAAKSDSRKLPSLEELTKERDSLFKNLK
jgi:hypothetical protein